MNDLAHEKEQLKIALRVGLERSEFLLHYQPQVDLRTGLVVGMEALIRWQHPQLGMVLPNLFIGIAEEAGLIVPIGMWVLHTACAQAKAWQCAGFGNLRISVNLSARQFAQIDLVPNVSAILAETGLHANCLDIELTENLVMADINDSSKKFSDLRDLGVHLSIDNFGTGYSSLSSLKRFPIDVLKIDQSFIHEVSEKTKDAAILEAVIAMAHSLRMKVIAEGVETERQCEFLSRTMCDEIQGHFYSRALPANEMEALLREARCLPQHLLRMYKPPRKLLLVDDEPNILAALKRKLRCHDYQILTASSGKEGLEILMENEIDVIVSDQRMPGMTGVEFLRTVKNLYPNTVRIVLSGFTELQSVTDAVNEGAIYKFLTKPWDDTQLHDHLEEAFQKKEMVNENRRLTLEVLTANQDLGKANRQLEHVLQQKQQQIKQEEAAHSIVVEALRNIPLPVICLDNDENVVFINDAAQALLINSGLVIGAHAAQVMPELLCSLHAIKENEKCIAVLNGIKMEATLRRLGHGNGPRGTLIIFTRLEAA